MIMRIIIRRRRRQIMLIMIMIIIVIMIIGNSDKSNQYLVKQVVTDVTHLTPRLGFRV